MTAFQFLALMTPALIGLALFATAAFVRRQNRTPQLASTLPPKVGLVVMPEFSLHSADDIRSGSRSETDDMELALAAVRERMAVSPHVLADVSVEIGRLSDQIHQNLDRMTDLLSNKARAR